jgi:hypothetical protein
MYQTLIASATVGAGGASTIDFTAIPSIYTDLTLVFSIRDNAAVIANSPRVRLNGDTGANYTTPRYVLGNGAAASSAGGTTAQTFLFFDYASTGASATASTFSNCTFYFPNYTSSSAKVFGEEIVSENNTSTGYMLLGAGRWSGTAVINSISIYNATFVQYSTAYLYGTLKGSGGATAA